MAFRSVQTLNTGRRYLPGRLMSQFLLITANVGSLFEPDRKLHNAWIKTIADKIKSIDPEFLIIHMQETGGKKFAECSSQVPFIINKLTNELSKFDFLRAYVDTDYEAIEYTALGALCYIKRSLWTQVYQYNFETKTYDRLTKPTDLISKGLEKFPYVVKNKFPKEFWPSIKWGRKGYMQSRWKIHNRVFDFVNAHLFHDESNLALLHENPYLYSQNRKRALDYILQKMGENENGCSPLLFIFGDLNFRLDSSSFLYRITQSLEQHELDDESVSSVVGVFKPDQGKLNNTNGPAVSESNQPEHLRRSVSAVEFRREADIEENGYVLRIEKKKFDYFNHKKLLDDWKSYLDDDKEARSFESMYELPIDFPPTYPWSEDPNDSESLMKTRAPAWCDRVLMNSRAFQHVQEGNPVYESFGMNTCTGDHKPVLLSFTL